MKLKHAAAAYVIVCVLVGAGKATAQPQLPDIVAGIHDGVVALSWVCQYQGVNAIVIKRSADSIRDYIEIGKVGNTSKGIQEFSDSRPMPGNNYYKAVVVFNSGLKWSSNTVRAYLALGGVARDNDTVVVREKRNNPNETKQLLSMGDDMLYPDFDMGDASFILPVHVQIDRGTGHVNINLPADFSKHRYLLAFYDLAGRLIMEVPRLQIQSSILDKRNFGNIGHFQFELRKDGVIFETGYIKVK